MGYNSTFTGSLTPNKPIPEELVKRINDAELDVRVAGGLDDNGEPGDLVPWAAEMHGYDFVEDIVKVQRLLSRHGIKLSGDIFRSGESGDDFDKVEVRRGRVYYRAGYLAYRKREKRGVESVTWHAVRVWRVTRGKQGERRKFAGWAGTPDIWGHVAVQPPKVVGGRPVTDRPPLAANRDRCRADAEKLARKLARKLAKQPGGSRSAGRVRCDIVSWEEAI